MSEIPLSSLRRNRPPRNGYLPLSDNNASPDGHDSSRDFNMQSSSRNSDSQRRTTTNRFGRKDRYTDEDLDEQEHLLEQEGVYDEESQQRVVEESRHSVFALDVGNLDFANYAVSGRLRC
jgi:hypothetical protein